MLKGKRMKAALNISSVSAATMAPACATIHAVPAFLLIGMLCINAVVQWKPP